MLSVRNDLDTLLGLQDPISGALPFVGPPVKAIGISDTYQLWTLIAFADYARFSGDDDWLKLHWPQYKTGVAHELAKVTQRGLLDASAAIDWGRRDDKGDRIGGGENIEANALLYKSLVMGADLARKMEDAPARHDYGNLARKIRTAINSRLWDEAGGTYVESVQNRALHPQDGNSLALWFGVVDSPQKAARINRELRRNWVRYGAVTPERSGAIQSFAGSMEIQAHFAANDDNAGLDLIRRQWGYMLDSPWGTRSTFWEGYLLDGSFDYHQSYMSLAHGWATGPTSALTFYVLGLSPCDGAQGAYCFIPHIGDLRHVEGALPLPDGKQLVQASWDYDASAGVFDATVTAPHAATGRVGIPTFGKHISIKVNGHQVWDGYGEDRDPLPIKAGINGDYVYLDGLHGTYSIHSSTVK